MAVLRFLFTRRWLGLLLVVVVVGFSCIELGLWQFRRYGERNAANAQITANLSAAPVPVGAVMSPTSPPAPEDEWRVVTARGTYDAARQFSVLYRTRSGSPGVEVVVPLRTASGVGLLVDRGWISTPGAVTTRASLPNPPAGLVTVTGWVRRNADDGSDQTIPAEGAVRAISSAGISAAVPYPLYDGFVEATHEQPATTPHPAAALAPDLGSGPHFFYGLQWFFFAILALGFWCYFAWTEYQQTLGKRPPSSASSQRASEPAVDRQHRPGDVASRR
jgi:cytochrome oxidase assembly protein ShyY1